MRCCERTTERGGMGCAAVYGSAVCGCAIVRSKWQHMKSPSECRASALHVHALRTRVAEAGARRWQRRRRCRPHRPHRGHSAVRCCTWHPGAAARSQLRYRVHTVSTRCGVEWIGVQCGALPQRCSGAMRWVRGSAPSASAGSCASALACAVSCAVQRWHSITHIHPPHPDPAAHGQDTSGVQRTQRLRSLGPLP